MTTTITPRDRRAPLADSLPALAPLIRLITSENGSFFALIALFALIVATSVALFGVPGLVIIAVVVTPLMLATLVMIARP